MLSRRARRRPAALDLRLLRRLARSHPVHLSARPAAGPRQPCAGSTLSSRTRPGHGPRPAARPSAPSSCRSCGRRSRSAALLVALFVMSDFGAVSIMRFDSFTREIYISYKSSFDRTATAGLGMVLVALMLGVLWVNARFRDALRGPSARPGLGPAAAVPSPSGAGAGRRSASARRSSWSRWCSRSASSSTGRPRASRRRQLADIIAALAGNSLMTGLGAALAGGVAALVVAVLAARYPSALLAPDRARRATPATRCRASSSRSRSSSSRPASPPRVYQTVALLVFALTVHYLPLAIGPIGASLTQVSPRVEEAARGLGKAQTRGLSHDHRAAACAAACSPAPRSSSCTRSRSCRLR